MELSSEDAFCLNVMLAAGVQAIRIDTSHMTVYGLTEKGEASVRSALTTRSRCPAGDWPMALNETSRATG